MKKISTSILSLLLMCLFVVPVSATNEPEYPVYEVNENQVMLIERGFAIEQVMAMSDQEITSKLFLRSSGYVDSTTTEVPNSRVYFTKKDVGLHPEFPNYKYTNGYYFANASSKASMSVSLGVSTGGTASFGIGISKASSSSGWFVSADSNRASRPMMFITGFTKRLKVVETDRYGGEYIRTYYLHVPIVQAEGARPIYM